MKWEKEYSQGSNLGRIGEGYWAGFMKRQGHLLVSKREQKYELDRSSWSTYTNFAQMYEQIANEMMEARVANRLGIAEWQDEKGAECDEKNAFGCKVTHRVTHPEKCLVMDEVGANIG